MTNNITLKVTDKDYENTFSGNNLREIVKEIVCNIYDINELISTYYYNNFSTSDSDFIDDIIYDLKNTGCSYINTDMVITLD